ncbi:hypothetical protein K227x_13870 [Rubripirellula lacrimiformis]|uniref:Uncharacterized protein n=1 Tax=Rubripirellula lacrimiformis TaxID=1930273 RepID=A0A517N7N4_9BACT|nr:hypothetical protein K227x_13870 [Rubripirellula lacrimiformis]
MERLIRQPGSKIPDPGERGGRPPGLGASGPGKSQEVFRICLFCSVAIQSTVAPPKMLQETSMAGRWWVDD